MATYMMLWNYTNEGLRNLKQSPIRYEENKQAFEAMGAKITEFYLTTGNFDGVMIVEAPDEQTIAKLALLVNSKGAIRTSTLQAYTEEEFRQIIDALPQTN